MKEKKKTNRLIFITLYPNRQIPLDFFVCVTAFNGRRFFKIEYRTDDVQGIDVPFYVTCLNSAPIFWMSKKQATIETAVLVQSLLP